MLYENETYNIFYRIRYIFEDFEFIDAEWYYTGLYMIGYGKGKIILKFPPFFRLNKENQERENSKHQMKTSNENIDKNFLFSFDFEFEFPALNIPHSIWRKAGISK